MALALSPTARDLIRSGLLGKDFDTYRSELIDFITARFGSEVASNIVASEQGIMLLELVAFALSTASWYLDRQADDTTLRDARLREAAVTIARQLGYKASASVPPVVTLTVQIINPSPLPVPLTIEKGRKLPAVGGLTYETVQTIVFDPTGTTIQTVDAREGISLEEVFTSDGTPNQLFELSTIPSGMTIAQDSPAITVAAIAWPNVDFLTYAQTDQVEIGYGFNPPRVLFGDGIAGNIPPKDAEIRVKYFATSATNGAIASNTISAFAEPLVAGTSQVTVTVTHNSPSSSGSNPETIEKIKTVAPLVFQAAKRAVTVADLTGLINAFVDSTYGAVAKGHATTPRTVSADAEALTIIALVKSLGDQLVALQPTQALKDSTALAATSVTDRLSTYWDKVLTSNCSANVVLAQILSADSVGRYVRASAGLAKSLEAYLDDRVESTVKVRVTDGTINLFSVDIIVGIKLLPNFNTQLAKSTITDTIRTQLTAILIGRDYGVPLRVGDIFQSTEGVQGVDYSHVTFIVKDSTGADVTSVKTNNFGDVLVNSFEVLTLGLSPTITILD